MRRLALELRTGRPYLAGQERRRLQVDGCGHIIRVLGPIDVSSRTFVQLDPLGFRDSGIHSVTNERMDETEFVVATKRPHKPGLGESDQATVETRLLTWVREGG